MKPTQMNFVEPSSDLAGNNQLKEAYYFSHDANARTDVKCIKLRREKGMAGYGIFWCLVEMLREAPQYSLPLTVIEDIAYDLHVDKDDVEAVVMNFDLFQIENGYFFSPRLQRSMAEYNARKIKHIEAGRKGGQASVKQRSSGGQPKKGKESKEERKINEKESKEEIIELDNDSIDFDFFWDLYDKKINEEVCEEKWYELSIDDQESILNYLPKYKAATPDKKFRKDPLRFLEEKTWKDEIIPHSPPAAAATKLGTSAARTEALKNWC